MVCSHSEGLRVSDAGRVTRAGDISFRACVGGGGARRRRGLRPGGGAGAGARGGGPPGGALWGLGLR
eukprot:1181893-Prorocentrum_minimum.AAC.2